MAEMKINTDDEDVQQAIQNATQAAYAEIKKFIGDKGSISMQFSEQLKTEIENLLSRYAIMDTP